ncbi:hypothetical protein F0562_025916 [Nyssa sinensis]|uniref:CCHC-type domain-containing protein n=1 Tax=Nyssa sinensis TaxID=561372 RepID=A0A5J5B9B9_9ASTE|nr:hypothetical protein F0562_025916 [Nyssa sinensis]
MKAGEGVSEYFSRVLSVANKMRTHGEQMQDVTVVEKILRSLSEKFNYVVCSIEESKDIDQLSIDELQSSLIVHEQKFQRHTGKEQALKITSEDKFGARGRGRGAYRGKGRGRGRQSYNKATVECYKCHKLGHFQSECPSWDKEANYIELGGEEQMLLMSYVEMNSAQREDVWSYEEHIMVDLEWDDEEDNEAVNAENDRAVSREEEKVTEEPVGSPQTGENGR